MRNVVGIVLLIGIIVGTPVLALVDPNPGHEDSRTVELPRVTVSLEKIGLADKTLAGNRARNFLSRHGGQWEFSVDGRTGRPVNRRRR